MTIEARRISRGVGASLLTLALLMIAAVPPAHADTIYPDNVITGSHFSTGLSHPRVRAGPRSATSARCCSGSSRTQRAGHLQRRHDARGRHRHAARLDAAGATRPPPTASRRCCSTRRRSRSPRTFTIGQAPAAGETTFQFDRRADVQAILDGDSRATYTLTLVNQTAGTRQRAVQARSSTTPTTPSRASSTTRSGRLPNVIAGNTYHLELSTLFDTAILTVALQRTIANFDNVRLRVQDGTSTFGAPTAVTDDADSDHGSTTATLRGRTNANGTESDVHVPLRPDGGERVRRHGGLHGDRPVQRRHRADVPAPRA